MSTREATPQQKVHTFFAAQKRRQYKAGQYLIEPHHTPKYVYYIINGQVSQFDLSHVGEQVVVNAFKTGAFFPMSHAFAEKVNTYFYQAFTDTDVYYADIQKVAEFIKADRGILIDLLQRVYSGTDGLLGRMSLLMGGDAESRLKYELLIQARRFGSADRNGTSSIPMTITELAHRTGLTRETASRTISELRNSGFVEVKEHALVVDPRKLEDSLAV